ncbi:MAG: RNA methyltransferase [Alphaproteobacteria bacterium]|nr:RNA methyltransferase [Alphaproteobacteria bacterium]
MREALRNKDRQHLILYATEPAARRLESEITTSGLVPRIVTTENLSRMLVAGAVHQGVALVTLGLSSPDLSAIPSGRGLVVVLDQITDPHNVGAILRLAAAFGVDAVITTERHAAELYGVTAKAASGGLEHVSVVRVVNLARALRDLGDLGYLRIGLDSEAATNLAAIELRYPLALVLGGEGKGLRRLSRENCDTLARLDLPGPIKSLNVSNACAVALTLLQRGLAASSTFRP